jgi:hypothetical protein
MDWLEAIRQIRALRLELARLDPRRGMPVAPPAGAPEHAIEGAERRMGMRLPPSYRALLAQHDGWPQVFAGAGLLGVRPLARGTYLGVARMVVEENEGGADLRGPSRGAATGAPRSRRSRRAGLVPFGIDPEGETLFAWDTGTRQMDGEMEVVLWTNGVGMRLPSFPDLLALIADMLSAELDERRERATLADATPQPSSRVQPVTRALRAGPATPRPVARIAALG